jgi:adenine-specific DNA-methyltransferase
MPSLNFKGKALVQNFHLLVPFHELKPVKAKSLTAKPSLRPNCLCSTPTNSKSFTFGPL